MTTNKLKALSTLVSQQVRVFPKETQLWMLKFSSRLLNARY